MACTKSLVLAAPRKGAEKRHLRTINNLIRSLRIGGRSLELAENCVRNNGSIVRIVNPVLQYIRIGQNNGTGSDTGEDIFRKKSLKL